MSEERQAKLQRLIEAVTEAHYAESALAETADSSTLEAYGDLRQLAGEYAAVRKRLGATPDDLAGDNRTRDTTYARHVAIYLLRRDARLSVSEIGRMLGGRDHATIIGGYKRIDGELKTRPETREDVEIIRGIVARIEAEEQGESA